MKIKYFGHSFMLVEGSDYSIALDPYGEIGLDVPVVNADYVFSSHSHYDHNNFTAVLGAKLVEKTDGRFTVIPSYHDNENGRLRGKNNILLFNLDGVNLAFMGDYGEDSNDDVVSKLYGVDILFIPVGGKYTIDGGVAKSYVDKIKPKAVVPIHYKIKGSTVDIKGVDNFLKYFGEFKTVNSPFEYNFDKGVIVVKPEKEEL